MRVIKSILGEYSQMEMNKQPLKIQNFFQFNRSNEFHTRCFTGLLAVFKHNTSCKLYKYLCVQCILTAKPEYTKPLKFYIL